MVGKQTTFVENDLLHRGGLAECFGSQSAQPKALLIELPSDIESIIGGQMLTGNDRLDKPGNQSLLLDVNKRPQLHRVGKWCKTRKNFRVAKGSSSDVMGMRRSWINKTGKEGIFMKFVKIYI